MDTDKIPLNKNSPNNRLKIFAGSVRCNKHDYKNRPYNDPKYENFCVKQLMDTGEHHINDKNKDGETALHIAVSFRDFEVVKELLTLKADPTIKSKNNLTPVETPPNIQLYLFNLKLYELAKNNYNKICELLNSGEFSSQKLESSNNINDINLAGSEADN